MAKAYVVCDIDVKDPTRYEDYRKLSTTAGEKYGATFLVRGGETETLEGGWRPNRFVILEFESEEAARRWYDSPEYREARAIRQECAESSFVLARGA